MRRILPAFAMGVAFAALQDGASAVEIAVLLLCVSVTISAYNEFQTIKTTPER